MKTMCATCDLHYNGLTGSTKAPVPQTAGRQESGEVARLCRNERCDVTCHSSELLWYPTQAFGLLEKPAHDLKSSRSLTQTHQRVTAWSTSEHSPRQRRIDSRKKRLTCINRELTLRRVVAELTVSFSSDSETGKRRLVCIAGYVQVSQLESRLS